MSVFFVHNSYEAFGSVSVESYLLDGEERSLALGVAEQGSEVVRQRISSFACLGGSRLISTFNGGVTQWVHVKIARDKSARRTSSYAGSFLIQ